jgi:hypothetical protein
MITEALRQFVRQRAGNRCEYCLSHQDYVMGRLQIDHILPEAKGGTDEQENLCLACEFCNQYKWTKTVWPDPVTNERVNIFNPRNQNWSEHFLWSDDGVEIIGLTKVGRATVEALRLNNQLAITVRKNWVNAKWHPPEL